ncbi:MAG TPA: CPBP family intramembrane glutamic endopeptidase [Acidimicrobiales bacterium]
MRRLRAYVVRTWVAGARQLGRVVGSRTAASAGALGALAVAAPVVKTVSLHSDWPGWSRQPLVAIAALAVAALVLAPGTRLRGVGLCPMPAGQPRDRAALWSVMPFAASVSATATIVLVLGRAGRVPWGDVAELVFVTAPGEELIFRGALLAIAYRSAPPRVAELVTAASFACWHVGDALNDGAGKAAWCRVAIVVGTLAITFGGGLLFSWMRHRTRSLAGAVLMHIATNLPGIALR